MKNTTKLYQKKSSLRIKLRRLARITSNNQSNLWTKGTQNNSSSSTNIMKTLWKTQARGINMIIPSMSTKGRRSKLIKKNWTNKNSLASSIHYMLKVKGEEGKERGMIFTSRKPLAKSKKSERPWRLLRKTAWPSSKDKSLEIKFQLNIQESERRKRLCSYMELLEKRMPKWKHWSNVWLKL